MDSKRSELEPEVPMSLRAIAKTYASWQVSEPADVHSSATARGSWDAERVSAGSKSARHERIASKKSAAN